MSNMPKLKTRPDPNTAYLTAMGMQLKAVHRTMMSLSALLKVPKMHDEQWAAQANDHAEGLARLHTLTQDMNVPDAHKERMGRHRARTLPGVQR